MPKNNPADEPIVCLPKRLPSNLWVAAAEKATQINPLNHPPINRLMLIEKSFAPNKQSIAVLTTKYWGNKGVKLTVGFMDNPSKELRRRILKHMNAWNKTANVQFVETTKDAQVRIARLPGDGHWSYLGTDVLSIKKSEATMNLDSFTMNTPESEYRRVVRHETGHTLGCPHEHMRRALVALIDPQKAIAFFGETQGWDPEMVRRQVLTPIEESSLIGTMKSDSNSIMCYQLPGSITKSGKPIVGGEDIDKSDSTFMASIYPKSKQSKTTSKNTSKKVTAKKRKAAPKR
jgi:hypothetical protein